MNFRRTSAGLSNQHLFLKVDAIVFVEGGQSFSKEEVMNGKFDTDSIDIHFWRALFSIFNKNKKLQFRAVGSKSVLKDITKEIESEQIVNVYVAMDRDFDNLKNTKIECKGVIYTYGYSWENDVWHIDVLEDVLNTICAADCKVADIKDKLLEIYCDFMKKIHVGVCADACLSIEDSTFFDRENYLKYLLFGKRKRPEVDSQKLIARFKECNSDKTRAKNFGQDNDTQVQRDCFGHFLSDFCYWLIVYFANKIGKVPPIAKHYINCIGIDKFVIRLSNRQFRDIHLHYDRSFHN